MADFLKRLFNEFVFGNFFIALCTVAMVWTTYLMNGFTLRITPFTIFLSLSTFLLYNLHRISYRIDYSGFDKIIHSVRGISTEPINKMVYAASFLAMIVCIFFIELRLIVYLLPMALLTLSYTIPFISRRERKIRLPELPLVKTPVLAMVWGVTTTLFPLMEQNISIDSSFIWLQVLSRCLFMLALCIPFEMRDIEIDKNKNIRTFPVVFGLKAAKICGSTVLLIEIILHHFMYEISNSVMIALDLSSVAAFLWIIFQNEKRSPYYYKFMIDGTMILRFLLLLIVIYER